LFEKPIQDKALYMGCSNDPECRRQGKFEGVLSFL